MNSTLEIERSMKLIITAIFISFLLVSCHSLIGYDPGYHRVQFAKWKDVHFNKIDANITLPEGYKRVNERNNYLELYLHILYPESALVEYTPTLVIYVRKFNEKEYSNPKYEQKHIHAPYFYKTAHYQVESEQNGRLGTDKSYYIVRHLRDKFDNILVISAIIYPWPKERNDWLEEDIAFAYKIVNSLKI